MRRTLRAVLLLAAATTILFFTACGADDTAEAGASITVQAEGEWLAYYEAAVDRVLAANPGAEISIIESGSFDMLDVLDSTGPGNPDVADVFAFPADRIFGLVGNDTLAPIDGPGMASRVGGFEDFHAGLGGAFNIAGEYFGFPQNIETLIIFANTQNAAAAGIDMDATIEFTELDFNTMLVPVFNAWFGVALTNSVGMEFLEQDGSGFRSDLTADWTELPADMQAVFTALFDYWAAHEAAGTPLWDASSAWGFMDSEFEPGGETALRLEGPWSTGPLTERAGSENIAVLPINQVTLNGNPLLHWRGGWGLGINARLEGTGAQFDLAVAFIEELMNTDFAVDFFRETGKIMENVPSSVFMESDLSESARAVIAAVIESYEDAPARPLFTEWGQVWSTWENALLSWAAVRPANAQAAYAEVQAAFRALMSNL